MDLVKKNILSVICGVVALAAIVFHFAFTSRGFSKLQAQATERAAKDAELGQLLKGPYALPSVTDGDAGKLGQFPNDKIIKVAEGVVGRLAQQSQALVSQAVLLNSNGYFVIVPDALPSPTNDQPKYDYRDQYNAVLKPGEGAKIREFQRRKPPNLPDDVLNSAVPPTIQEIQVAKDKLWKEQYYPKLIMVEAPGSGGQKTAINQKDVVTEFFKATANFDEEFRRTRAMSYKVYLEPNALAISPRLDQASNKAPAVEDIWFAQMSLWIQHDVCNAIARMNALSKTIPTSPVKHLVAVDVRQDYSMYVGAPAPTVAVPAAAPVDSGDGGGEAASAPEAQTKNFSLSPTGRVWNKQSLFDVVPFEFVVVVDREYVQGFLRQIQYGRVITVVESDMQNIDLDEAVSQGYDYGKRPVVEVKIKCEALFLRQWTAHRKGTDGKPIWGPMPPVVQGWLQIPPPAAAAPAQPVEAVVQQ